MWASQTILATESTEYTDQIGFRSVQSVQSVANSFRAVRGYRVAAEASVLSHRLLMTTIRTEPLTTKSANRITASW